MPDEMAGEPKTDVDANATQQPPPPILPPPVEGNENGEGSDDEPNRDHIQETHVKPKHWTKYAEAVCAIALVLITGYYTRAAYRQAKASETAATAARDAVRVACDTLAETQRSNARQEALTDAARIASQQAAQNAITASQRASQQSLRATQNAMRQDQRAWIGIKDIKMSHPLTKGTDIDFGINAVNTGKTPALDVRLVKMSVGLQENQPDNTVTPTDRSVIAPGNNEVFYGSGKGPSPQLIAGLNAKKTRFYVWGKIDYRDIFNNWHTTLFCGYYPGSGTTLNFYNCSKGNSMN